VLAAIFMGIRLQTCFSFFSIFICFSCSYSDNKKLSNEAPKNVELDLVIPHFSDRIFYIGCSDNELSVILRNRTDSIVDLRYRNDAYDNANLSFEIKTFDSTYIISKKENGWAHNMPTDLKVEPLESAIFTCNLVDYNCYLGDKKNPLIRGDYHGWEGLPQKVYDSAFIKAIYEIKDSQDSSLQKLESIYYKVKIEKI
jgi:hypothetical protein